MVRKLFFAVAPFLLCCFISFGQQVQLKVASNPPQFLADWENQKQLVITTVTTPPGQSLLVRIGCVIQSGSTVVARTDIKRVPVVRLDQPVKIFYTDDVLPANALIVTVPDNKLPEGDYNLCVRLFDEAGQRALTQPVCQPFSIRSYQQPQLILPADKSILLPAQAKTIQFRWTPVSPMPTGIVTYKLQVFEVMSGQYPEQAVRSNQPVLEKELPGATQFIWIPQNDIQPNQYVWTVQALDREGRPIGKQDGRATPFTFRIGSNGNMDTPQSGQNITINLINPPPCYHPGDVVHLQYSGAGYSSGNTYIVTLLQQASANSYYQVQLINSAMPYTAGAVSFTLSNTIAPGTYVLHIHGNTNLSCGGYDLSPPIVICNQPPECKCGHWKNITMGTSLSSNDGTGGNNNNNNTKNATVPPVSTQPLQCGKTYNVECGKKYSFNFSYQCNPDSCKSSYTIIIKEPSNNIITYTNINPGTINYTFTSAGQYTMTVFPKCGNHVCDTCKIIFNTNCQDCCKELLKEIKDQKPWLIGNVLNINSIFIATQPIQSVEETVISMQSTISCTNPASTTTQPIASVISSGSLSGYSVVIPYQSEIDFSNGSSTTVSPLIQLMLPPPPSSMNCKQTIKICIRYLLRYENCKTCEVIRCYSITRSGGIVIPDINHGKK